MDDSAILGTFGVEHRQNSLYIMQREGLPIRPIIGTSIDTTRFLRRQLHYISMLKGCGIVKKSNIDDFRDFARRGNGVPLT